MHTHSKSTSARGLAVLVIALILAACSRQAPASFTTHSPTSPDAQPAPIVDVTLALDGDPPMPGDAASGWIGLERPTAPGHDHAGHQGHQGHEGHAEQPTKPAHEGGHHHGH